MVGTLEALVQPFTERTLKGCYLSLEVGSVTPPVAVAE